MVVFKSLIVFDAETTALPQFDHNTTRITELAFLGCEIDHLKNSQELPRALHKLVLLFNPQKPIRPDASRVSGLTNELLENVEPFRKEDVEILRHFVSHLPSPVCLVAHNGDIFDFPILRRALEKLNTNLQNNVYCADSLKAFSDLLPKVEKPLWTRRSLGKDSERTPTQSQTQQICTLKGKNVSRVLFPEEEVISNNKTEDTFICPQPLLDRPQSYRLKDIYKFYYGGYFRDAHRAEEDAKALLSCIKRCNGFLDWMNENAVIFNSVPPLS